MTKRYFKVEAKCGHVGHGKCIWITFATAADNDKEAAKKVRDFKRVKHDHKDAIASVEEITFEDFIALKATNDADPYLHCKNIQEQRRIPDFEQRIELDYYSLSQRKRSDSFFRKRLIKSAFCGTDYIPKRYRKEVEYA